MVDEFAVDVFDLFACSGGGGDLFELANTSFCN